MKGTWVQVARKEEKEGGEYAWSKWPEVEMRQKEGLGPPLVGEAIQTG